MDTKTMLTGEWILDQSADQPTWHYCQFEPERGYVSRYRGNYGYNWQAIRKDHRASGSADSEEEAMQAAIEHLSMPIEQFNAIVIKKLVFEIDEKINECKKLDPKFDADAGYAIGYNDGFSAARNKMLQATQ